MFDIKENLKTLPETPGVYLHKDKLGQVIYVGKAINLKRRVSSYFQNSANHTDKVRAMVSNVESFEVINCRTEMEALILECNLIKKYQPKYNILLRDDKTYPYIKVTNEDFPRIIKTRILLKDGAKYFGPYSDATAVNNTIELLNKVFVLKRCSARAFPSGYKACLNYHINECRGICQGTISKEEYNKYIKRAIKFLNGDRKDLVSYLESKMNLLSEDMKFEEAAVYRDYLRSIDALSETQRVTMVSGKNFDMVLAAGRGNNTSIVLFTVRDGKLVGRETFDMQAYDEDRDELVSEFIKQYYITWADVPREILVSKDLKEKELIEAFLEDHSGHKVEIHEAIRGEKRALLDLARRDVIEMEKTLEIKLENQREQREKLTSALSEILGKNQDTFRVESYDISNTNGVDTVGAMVVFQNEKPVRKDYRRFKIKTITGQDDYGSLAEMLTRRFQRYLDGDPSFSTLPDMILMDGGQGQVSSAEKVLVSLNIPVPVLGMAKDDNHRTRALVNGLGDEYLLKNNPLLFKYCGTIQEEVHRFAIEYHRSLHTKNAIGSVLDNIPGIGPKKRNTLLTHFSSIDEIKEATVYELQKCPGINSKDAENIKKFFESTK